MNQHSLQQDIDLWEAWIEFDALAPNRFGTLYVMGEVLIANKGHHPFIIKCAQQMESHTLSLQVLTTTSAKLEQVAEVVYAEPLQNIDQYFSIKIYADDELIAHLEDIEILI